MKQLDGLLVGGEFIKIGDNTKAVTLPAWAREWMEQEGGATEAQLYKKSPWANRCIGVRMDTIAGIPWEIQRRVIVEGDEAWRAVPDNHPLVLALRNVDNEYNWIDLAKATEGDTLIYGVAYWLKIGRNRLSAIRRLNPSTIKIVAGPAGIKEFVQQLPNQNEIRYPREFVVYFRDYDPVNDLGGLSRVRVAQRAIEVDYFADRFVKAFFENYAIPAALITTDQKLQPSDQNRLRDAFRRFFRGTENAHKAMVVDSGLKVEQLSYPLEQLALETVREEARRSICTTFGVPPIIAGAWEAANYATADEARQSLYTETILPKAHYMASVINSELVWPIYGEGIRFAWKEDELDVLQPDQKSEAERYTMLVSGGIITHEAAAARMGFTEDEVGEGRQAPPSFEPRDKEEDEDEEEEEEMPPRRRKSPLQIDLEKWCRKSINRVKAGKSADVEFESEHIPLALEMAILGSLEDAATADEVKAIFDSSLDYELMPFTHKAQAQPIEVNVDARTSIDPPDIHIENKNILPEQEPPDVSVQIDNQVETPEVHVHPEVKAPDVTVEQGENIINVDVDVPKMRRSKESQKVDRDKQGMLKGSESVTEYEYDE